MWIFDDLQEMEEFQIYQQEVRRLETECIESRYLLRDAEEELKAEPENILLLERVRQIMERVRDLEGLEPRLVSNHIMEGQVGIAPWMNARKGFAAK